MGYIKKEITEEVTHKKSVGMVCDVCGEKTDIVDDPGWFGFYARTYFYDSDGNDNEWYIVCSPECFLRKMSELIQDTGDNEDFEFADMDLEFAKKFIKLLPESKT